MNFKEYREQERAAVLQYRRCWKCGAVLDTPGSGAAHILADTKPNASRYTKWVLANRLNLLASCHAHNDAAMGIARGDKGKDDHAGMIATSLAERSAAGEQFTICADDAKKLAHLSAVFSSDR